MLDLTSLFYALIISFGIFGLDAVWNAGTIKTDFQVSDSLGSAGVKQEFATTVFSRELQVIFSTASLIKAPEIRSSHDKSFISLIAESAGLNNATAAFQDLFGLHPVKIIATLTTEGWKTRLEVVGETVSRGTFYLTLAAETDETAVELIRRGALETAIKLDAYHTALYLLDPAVGGAPDAEDIVKARRVLDDAIAARAHVEISPTRGRFRNLRGILALVDGDKAAAAALFEQAVADAPDLMAAHLNLAFTRAEQDRFADAGMIVRHVLQTRQKGLPPALVASANTIAGVVAWSQKQHDVAERHFKAAVAAEPTVSDAYIYWGRMLTEIGRNEEGRSKVRQGEANEAEFQNHPEVALLYFWLTREVNVPLQFRTRGYGAAAPK